MVGVGEIVLSKDLGGNRKLIVPMDWNRAVAD
jgi:hypothetical protein